MKRFKKYMLVLTLLPLALLCGMTMLNMYLDPDGILSKTKTHPFFSTGKKHYKIAGIINNFEIRNITAGGSLLANVIPSEVEAALGWRDVYSLTVNASEAATVAAIAGQALKRHKIEHVLISLQPERLAEIPASQRGKRGGLKNFINLYDDNRLNDVVVFFQGARYYLEAYRDNIRQREKIEKAYPGLDDAGLLAASKDLFSHYMERCSEFNRPLFISSLAAADSPRLKLSETHKINLRQNLEEHIIPIISANPKTEFLFVVEPATFLGRKPSRDIFAHALRFLAEKLLQNKNVKIYSFAGNDFNGDLRLFKDLDHAHIEVSRYMLRSIAKDRGRITAENLEPHIQDVSKKLDDYEAPDLWKTDTYKFFDSPYPKQGYLTYADAARLVWGPDFSPALFASIPRSTYLDEKNCTGHKPATSPPLDASRQVLGSASDKKD